MRTIIGLILSIFLVILVLQNIDALKAFLSSMAYIGPGNPRDQQWIGLCAFGLVALLIASIAKIVTAPKPPQRPHQSDGGNGGYGGNNQP